MAATRRSASGTGWEAHPLRWPARATPGGRWGSAHRPTGRWVAFGTEARCRRLVAQLTAAGAGRRRLAAADAAGGVARHDARR